MNETENAVNLEAKKIILKLVFNFLKKIRIELKGSLLTSKEILNVL